jgi:hypothetical protein
VSSSTLLDIPDRDAIEKLEAEVAKEKLLNRDRQLDNSRREFAEQLRKSFKELEAELKKERAK